MGTHRPNFALRYLERFDRRLEANLDALAVAGTAGRSFSEAGLERPSAGAVFVPTVRAIHDRDLHTLERLLAVTLAVPDSHRGFVSAFGWVEPQRLQGLVAELLAANEPALQTLGLAACGLQRVDPGDVLSLGLRAKNSGVRMRAAKVVGQLGLLHLKSDVAPGIRDDDPGCRFWAAWALVLLGERRDAIEVLRETVTDPSSSQRRRAFRLGLQAMNDAIAREFLRQVAQDEHGRRLRIEACGILGDPAYVPWLIEQMNASPIARHAGEAFTLITRADLASFDLERKPPENFESGPNDDPNDPNIDMDPDDGLPWPDVKKVEAWWQANESRFQQGTRYFMGKPVTREHCIDVLKNGYQRQRILAAHYLCLLEPGTPLFNTSAPAWRQQRLLAQM